MYRKLGPGTIRTVPNVASEGLMMEAGAPETYRARHSLCGADSVWGTSGGDRGTAAIGVTAGTAVGYRMMPVGEAGHGGRRAGALVAGRWHPSSRLRSRFCRIPRIGIRRGALCSKGVASVHASLAGCRLIALRISLEQLF